MEFLDGSTRDIAPITALWLDRRRSGRRYSFCASLSFHVRLYLDREFGGNIELPADDQHDRITDLHDCQWNGRGLPFRHPSGKVRRSPQQTGRPRCVPSGRRPFGARSDSGWAALEPWSCVQNELHNRRDCDSDHHRADTRWITVSYYQNWVGRNRVHRRLDAYQVVASNGKCGALKDLFRGNDRSDRAQRLSRISGAAMVSRLSRRNDDW